MTTTKQSQARAKGRGQRVNDIHIYIYILYAIDPTHALPRPRRPVEQEKVRGYLQVPSSALLCSAPLGFARLVNFFLLLECSCHPPPSKNIQKLMIFQQFRLLGPTSPNLYAAYLPLMSIGSCVTVCILVCIVSTNNYNASTGYSLSWNHF